jgi:hypothetical protein
MLNKENKSPLEIQQYPVRAALALAGFEYRQNPCLAGFAYRQSPALTGETMPLQDNEHEIYRYKKCLINTPKAQKQADSSNYLGLAFKLKN